MELRTDYSNVSFQNNGKLKLLIIVGTRPEIIRLAAVINKARRYFDVILAHTGQNYDYNLNGVFFKDLKLQDPEVYMNAVGDDLGGALHDGRRAVANVDNSVSAQSLGLIHHALDRDLTGLVEHLSVAGDLAAHQGFHASHEVLAKILGLDHGALYNTKHLEFLSGNVINIYQQHLILLLRFL